MTWDNTKPVTPRILRWLAARLWRVASDIDLRRRPPAKPLVCGAVLQRSLRTPHPDDRIVPRGNGRAVLCRHYDGEPLQAINSLLREAR